MNFLNGKTLLAAARILKGNQTEARCDRVGCEDVISCDATTQFMSHFKKGIEFYFIALT